MERRSSGLTRPPRENQTVKPGTASSTLKQDVIVVAVECLSIKMLFAMTILNTKTRLTRSW
jgi:hypothetical protein